MDLLRWGKTRSRLLGGEGTSAAAISRSGSTRLLAPEHAGDDLVAAGLLHAVLEDSTFTKAEIADAFGAEIAALVADLSEDPTIHSYAERKRDLRLAGTEFRRGRRNDLPGRQARPPDCARCAADHPADTEARALRADRCPARSSLPAVAIHRRTPRTPRVIPLTPPRSYAAIPAASPPLRLR